MTNDIAALFARHEALDQQRVKRANTIFYVLAALMALVFVLPVFTAGRKVPDYRCDPKRSDWSLSSYRSYDDCAAQYRSDALSTAAMKAGVGVLLGGLMVGFALLLSKGSRKNRERLRAALENPANVLWLYLQERRVSGAALYRFVVLKLRDGTETQLAAPFAEAEGALNAIRALAPHAIVGFGEAQQAEYQAKRGAA